MGFGFFCESARQVFKGGRPESENSKLVKAPTVPKVTTGAHWHRYTGVLGSANAYGRKQRSPQHGAAVLRCGVVSTRRAGAPPAVPPTPSNPTASLRTTRALESDELD